ncbi:MAG: DUF3604 domain-containing protein [Myxococcota bacterium]
MPISTRALLLALALALPAVAGTPFERTEERQDCAHYDALRRPLFGDLHVHTSYSFDSLTSLQRNDPWDAYRYAKGEPILLSDADGNRVVEARLRRPLDFASVTDHSEYLGEIHLCSADPWTLAYWTPLCLMSRSDIFYVHLLAARQWVGYGVTSEDGQRERAYVCDLPGTSCEEAHAEAWSNIQRAAEEHYDRSAACSFTTFVGYEYTDAPSFKNLHRNVIFRNERVTDRAISTYDTGSRNFPRLWRMLRDECRERGDGCDVMSIPHNPNLSAGLMFPDPASEEEARLRLEYEPVAELVQHKASSECRFDRIAGRGVGTEDELCTFEQNKTDNLASLGVLFGERRTEAGAPVPIDAYGRRNMLRNVLKDGLALERRTGTNPFKMGFIGSTDTHSATPGGTMERPFEGHLGRRDAGYRNVQDHFEDNPGGLAVVWAEENSRDAIFAAIRRKETYATSGTRPTVRFFGGWGYDPALCSAPGWVEAGYAGGVPMGGDLPPAPDGAGAPRFLVHAGKDAGSPGFPGLDLQRVQVVKGFLDADGQTHERVFDVAGGPNGASVDPDTCAPTGRGHATLCAVWRDPEFDASQPAFYYARVLENPSCRWSTWQCQAAGVNPFAADCQERADAANRQALEAGARGDVWGNCCRAEHEEPFYAPILQERVWTSPIWYPPEP